MSLKSILKKRVIATLLALNISCNSLPSQTYTEKQLKSNLEAKVKSEPKRLKAYAYPINILAGYITTALEHEANHALVGTLCGAKINRLAIPRRSSDGAVYPCSLIWDNYPAPGTPEATMTSLAGPLGQRLFIEAINYNLRNGNVSQRAQPFWATTSLIARTTLFETLAGAFKGNTKNDFSVVSRNTGISPETMLGILVLDAALNYQRIAEEFRVAIGKKTYKAKPKKARKKARIDLYPSKKGYFATYTRRF